jgi:Holliday junction resolvasome RuvABC ATP-dependent DNA helicase subunit
MTIPITTEKGLRIEDSFSGFIGQTDAIARLRDYNLFCSFRRTVPGPILLTAEDGMGTTRIAEIFANERDKGFQETQASTLAAEGDLTALLTNVRENQILLLSRINLLPKKLIPKLAQAIRTGRLRITIGTGRAARQHDMEVKPFTLFVTCPKQSDCPAELREDFSLTIALQTYSLDALAQIAMQIAKRSRLEFAPTAAQLIVRHCERKPRSVEATLARLARTLNKKDISEDDVRQVLALSGTRVQSTAALDLAGDMSELSGQDFERLICRLLERMEFRTELTKVSGDGGIDIIAFLDKPIIGGKYIFQCKRYAPNNFVGVSDVREFYGVVATDHAVKGVFITTSDFTPAAREFAETMAKRMELINMTQLRSLLDNYAPSKLPEQP